MSRPIKYKEYPRLRLFFFITDHDWFVAKMKIAQIAMVDWFGGAKYVPVKDYLAYNYTGNEMLEYHNKLIHKDYNFL